MLHVVLGLGLALQDGVVNDADRAAPRGVAALERFQGYDQDGDGTVEIVRLERLFERAAVSDETSQDSSARPRVVLFVEPRLLAPLEGGLDLRPRLERLADDLAREGRAVLALAPTFERSGDRDGRLVLALREVLREVARDDAHPLEAALLIGRLPDAVVVRTIDWWQVGDERFPRADGSADGDSDAGADEVRGAHLVRRIPEAVAMRADIVLADLDGRWEDVYFEERRELPFVVAAFAGPMPPEGGRATHVRTGALPFADAFHVVDGELAVSMRDGAPYVAVDPRARDRECSASDRALGNPLPRPEIAVSRIDARGTACVPRSDVRGLDGGGLLDADGAPRRVVFESAEALPHWRDGLFVHDERFERELLAAFLDRNHAYRNGRGALAWSAASLAHDLWSGRGVVARAAPDFERADDPALDVHGRPTIAAALAWLCEPAVLRTVRAHSDPWGSVFEPSPVLELDAALGDAVWSWTPDGAALVPSLGAAAAGGKLDWFLLHALWRSGRAPQSPSFYLHTGCEAITPPGVLHLAHDDPSYGVRQGAEALLFFGGGLALVGRAKVFYDEPPGFCEALAEGATFGEAWRRGFEIEARAADWDAVGGDIGRKRTLFWSVLGDATVRLARPPANAR
jgi:hypothetical protein